MINTSKILTVSYGTFSCTLEGFDDSFDTMKAIAEYFRDLAADDRYFGAEPPTPDAEMLARIAEREVERRVEAYMDKGNIVLRTSEAASTLAPLAAPATAPFSAPASPATPAPAADQAVDASQTPAPKSDAKTASEPAPHADAPTAAETPHVSPLATPAAPENATETDSSDVAEDRAEFETAAISPTPPPVQDTPQDNIAATALNETTESAAAPEADLEDADLTKAEAAEAADTSTVETAQVEENTEIHEEVAPQHTADVEGENSALEEADAANSTETVDTAAAEVAQTEAMTLAAIAARVANPAPSADAATTVDSTEAPHTPVTHPDQNSVAAKLQRIRAVVSKTESESADTSYTEDQHADAAIDTPAEEHAGSASAAEATAETPSEVSSILARLSREHHAETAMSPITEEPATDQATDDVDAQDAATSSDAQPHPEAEIETQVEEILNDEITDAIVPDDAADATSAADPETHRDEDSEDAYIEVEEIVDPAATAAPADQPTDQTVHPLRARVIRMKRSEFDAALAAGQIEEAYDDEGDVDLDGDLDDDLDGITDGDSAETATAPNSSTLSQAEEAELQRELAAVEAELAEDTAAAEQSPPPVAEAEAPRETETEEPAARGASRLRDSQPDLNRMLEKTESQMDEPDGSRRRNAIAHLRAAVAATKAEQRAGTSLKEERKDDAYRGDLADVVRPRRPHTGPAARSARPSDARPAPLKLVAEQRVDVSAEPVRPRRISVTELAATQPPASAEVAEALEKAGSFADYAENVGASKLPDLLEAAAAYLSFVEGMEQFSRPQLMTKVRQVEAEDFSREDGLRSFGQLLRAGKIRKIKGGRFQVSDEIGYRPSEREAG